MSLRRGADLTVHRQQIRAVDQATAGWLTVQKLTAVAWVIVGPATITQDSFHRVTHQHNRLPPKVRQSRKLDRPPGDGGQAWL